ncbi:hypothetical protein LCGC14_0868770 [marine sediment metagenome]|uniref:Uncharacterized protein n=1 Tax=marine sediment metagenome TaxID=412755 RepID=A0A0F9RPX2_9ZZZZ
MRKLIEDRRGNYADVFIFIIMSFVVVIFFGIMYYGFSLFDTALSTIQFDIGDTNFTTIVDQTWGEVYDAYDQLKTIAYVLIFGMILTMFINAWAIRRPPIFLIIWIITSLVSIIVGVYISNTYQLLLNNQDFGSTLQSFSGASYLILYMPYLAGIFSLLNGLISLVGINRSKREEGAM